MLSVYAFRMSMAAFFCPGVSWLSFLLSSSSATWDADGTESRISTSADTSNTSTIRIKVSSLGIFTPRSKSPT